MYEGRYAYCSVIVDKKFSSTICISKSVFIFKCIFPKCIYPKCIFAKCTRIACLLRFASLLDMIISPKSYTRQSGPTYLGRSLFTIIRLLMAKKIDHYRVSTFAELSPVETCIEIIIAINVKKI